MDIRLHITIQTVFRVFFFFLHCLVYVVERRFIKPTVLQKLTVHVTITLVIVAMFNSFYVKSLDSVEAICL